MKALGTLVAACMLAALPAQAGVDPLVKCEFKKIAAVGKKAAAVLKCHSKALKKGVPVDSACLDKASEKFAKLFEKAEKKAACASPPGDATSIEAKIDGFTAEVVAALPPGPDGARCASTKLKAAGKKIGLMSKAVAKDTKKPDQAKFVKTFAKSQDKLDKGFDKAEGKSPCETTGDATAVRRTADLFLQDVLGTAPSCPEQLLYASEGNRLRRFDLDTVDDGPLVEDILIERASLDPVDGRDVNGEICTVPGIAGAFVQGEDTGQPSPPPGWGVFDATGAQIGKLTATYFAAQGEPFGCAFDSAGNLFTSSIGEQPSGSNGQLIMWFPPYDEFPGAPGEYPATNDASTTFCKIAVDISVAGTVAVDDQDRVYVGSSAGGHVRRYSPPFPTGPDGAGGCGSTDALGSPLVDSVSMDVFIADPANVFTPSGIVRAPNGNWYVSSVLTGVIAEYDEDGDFVRRILEPGEDEEGLPLSVGHPQGLAVDCEGSLYYADLALVSDGGGIGPGPGGTVRRIAFDMAGLPHDPVTVRGDLSFPDGLGIFDDDLEGP